MGLDSQQDSQGMDELVTVDQEKVFCRLLQCQRSSEEILTLANYMQRHVGRKNISYNYIRKKASFTDGHLPIWIRCYGIEDFVNHAPALDLEKDVMLIYDAHRLPEEISELSSRLNWKVSHENQIVGSEASQVILFDPGDFSYEAFTRAKHRLIIVHPTNTRVYVSKLQYCCI